MKDTLSEFAKIPMFLVQARPSYSSRRVDPRLAVLCRRFLSARLPFWNLLVVCYVFQTLSLSRLRTGTPYGDGLRRVGHFLRSSRIKAQLILSRTTFIHFFSFALILLPLPATAPVCY